MSPVNEGRTAAPGVRLVGPVLLLSAALLAQELLLVRLLAVAQWHHITYMVVTTALLALGVAGTLLAVAPWMGGRDAEQARGRFVAYTFLFAASSFGTAWAAAFGGVDTVEALERGEGGWGLLRPSLELFRIYLITGLPLLFGGLALASALRHAGPRLARTYFANLLGSGAGCALFLVLLEPLTGPGLLAATAGGGALAGLHAALPRPSRPALAAGLALAGAALAFTLRPSLFPVIRPVASKKINEAVLRGEQPLARFWNPLCRVDVTRAPDGRHLSVFQDGDAPTWIYPMDAPDAVDTRIPWILAPEAETLLVIGAGGGREMAAAVRRGARRIVGVEINSSTVRLLREHYREFTRGRETHRAPLLEQPGVALENAEGRAWLARHPERFDLIQMTGVDTYAALSSGAYVVSESYLYTAEAFDAYLDHLTERGHLCLFRFFFTPPRETLRLFVMALEALRRRGVRDPGRHVLVVRWGNWGALVVGRSPIAEERAERVRRLVRALKPPPGGRRAELVHDPGRSLKTPFAELALALREGRARAFLDAYPFDVRPVHDDSPFFYLYHRWSRMWDRLLGRAAPEHGLPGTRRTTIGRADAWRANTGEVPTGLLVLLSLLVQATALGIIAILGPLAVLRARAIRLRGSLRATGYFCCLGLGFMLVEIGLAQKLSLFLGHPTASLAVVIGGMLVGAGLGSLVSGALPARRALVGSTLAVALLLSGLPLLLPALTHTWLQAAPAVRSVIALALLAPLAFLMGMPMPSGLRLVSRRGGDLVPWAWGVNGVASVLGSVLAVVLAMGVGFSGVLWTAAALYGLAALLGPAPREGDA